VLALLIFLLYAAMQATQLFYKKTPARQKEALGVAR
jgi:hypothetical protein